MYNVLYCNIVFPNGDITCNFLCFLKALWYIPKKFFIRYYNAYKRCVIVLPLYTHINTLHAVLNDSYNNWISPYWKILDPGYVINTARVLISYYTCFDDVPERTSIITYSTKRNIEIQIEFIAEHIPFYMMENEINKIEYANDISIKYTIKHIELVR